MSKATSASLFLRLILLSAAFWSCGSSESDKLSIAAAANVQFAMQTLVDSFSQQTNIPCQIILNSSGKLTAQIRQGAPYDVFVSANMKYPASLYQEGWTTQAPEIYALGSLVLWTQKAGLSPTWSSLTQASVRHIALANPRNAPYGEAAVSALRQQGLFDAVQGKLVYGESIAQTNQFILSEGAEIGFTAKSVVFAPQMSNQGNWQDIDPHLYQPIAQGAIVIERGQTKEKLAEAEAFYAFLFSPKAQDILQQYGYRAVQE